MHGLGDENRKRWWSQHMRSAPSRNTRAVAGEISVAPGGDSFCKDGRKISVGDCALFKPPQESPPFIGIIRWLSSNKENHLKLGVNWLYRPAEVKLGKGILLDAAPNEIFYSFHKDEIPAASLLHPCKVAFLPKAVELSPGTSSFVCRRVYDIENKCLWWLTDQDYIDERQEEVDQLLNRTRVEMHATVQPGGRSPKQINGPTPTSHLKSGSDNVQNSVSSYPSQVKGKKRDRGDQGSEPCKRERSSKSDDGDLGQFEGEFFLKSEIARITEKGGLVDPEGVEKLVQLLQPDKVERKMDLNSRSMLAGVIAATDKFECLSLFVQRKGLPVLDEWLQDVNKGKLGDGNSPKDSDKPLEEFLLVLLRALDKLPVNLNALQKCNIGRSVNHLRSHKNLEIQKKARSLVDTWKKRVEAEMNIIDAKSGSSQAASWPSKSRLPEVSHGVNRHAIGPSEVAMKSSISQFSASKIASVKPVQGESTVKSSSLSPGAVKSAVSTTTMKDGQPRISVGSGSDLPLSTPKEEKSSSSGQSHNYNQSFSVKEEARSSTAGSMSGNKNSSGASRHRKSLDGFPGTAVSGIQRDGVSSRSSSLCRISAQEKFSPSGLTCDKGVDVQNVEGNSHKMIVKIPNRGRSPAQSAGGGSSDDPSIMNSRASSPALSGLSDKRDQYDTNLREKNDAYPSNVMSDMNTESWKNNDIKDALTGSDEGDASPAANCDGERNRTVESNRKSAEVSKAGSSYGKDLKSGRLHDAAFSSINALIESCVKYSGVNPSLPLGDDTGMNLLASVAAGEMSRSDLVSPVDSGQTNTPSTEETRTGDGAKPKSSAAEGVAPDRSLLNGGPNGELLNGGPNGENEKQGVIGSSSSFKDGPLSKHALVDVSGSGKIASSSEEMPVRENNENFNSSGMDLQPADDPCLGANLKSDEMKGASSSSFTPVDVADRANNGETGKELHEEKPVITMSVDCGHDSRPRGIESFKAEDRVQDVQSTTDEKLSVDASSSYPSSLAENKNNVSSVHGETLSADMMKLEHRERKDEDVTCPSASCETSVPDNVDMIKLEKVGEIDKGDDVYQAERKVIDQTSNPPIDSQPLPGLDLAVTDQKSESMEPNVERKEELKHFADGVSKQETPEFPAQEAGQHASPRASKPARTEPEKTEERSSTKVETAFSAAGTADMDSKLKFDLNEGFIADDGKYGEQINSTSVGCSSTLHLLNPLSYPISSVSSSLPASITVAAAAKGPFVPPEDLLRSKGELGWKGSAATSAFRPAEPRKVLEIPVSTAKSILPDSTASRQGRVPFDFDLNVPDERVLEDMASRDYAPGRICSSDLFNSHDLAGNELAGSAPSRCSGGLDLDLNRVDEANDMVQYLTSSSCRQDASRLHVNSLSSSKFPNGEDRRGFDLNNGPGLDDPSGEPSSSNQNGTRIQSQPPVSGLRLSNPEIGNMSPWFQHGNTYSAVALPSILPDRGGEQQPFPIVAPGATQRILGPSGATSFTPPDVFRGSVLSSSPALPFHPTQFQYPFHFGTSFPVPSATFSGASNTYIDSSAGGRLGFPAMTSPLLGPPGAGPPNYPRPYMFSLTDGGNSPGMETNRRWNRQGLDLNAGPGGLDMEGRDETVALASRQLSVASSQAAEEQVRMYQVASSVLKRKEPEGSWDSESFRYKQSSWQQ